MGVTIERDDNGTKLNQSWDKVRRMGSGQKNPFTNSPEEAPRGKPNPFTDPKTGEPRNDFPSPDAWTGFGPMAGLCLKMGQLKGTFPAVGREFGCLIDEHGTPWLAVLDGYNVANWLYVGQNPSKDGNDPGSAYNKARAAIYAQNGFTVEENLAKYDPKVHDLVEYNDAGNLAPAADKEKFTGAYNVRFPLNKEAEDLLLERGFQPSPGERPMLTAIVDFNARIAVFTGLNGPRRVPYGNLDEIARILKGALVFITVGISLGGQIAGPIGAVIGGMLGVIVGVPIAIDLDRKKLAEAVAKLEGIIKQEAERIGLKYGIPRGLGLREVGIKDIPLESVEGETPFGKGGGGGGGGGDVLSGNAGILLALGGAVVVALLVAGD